MLNLTEVATYLSNKFNGIGSEYDPAYTFCIYSEIGKNDNSAYIQGVLKSEQPKITPINGVKNAFYNLSIDLTIPAPRSNFNLKNVEDITGKVAESINGTTEEFGDGSGYITMTLTGTGAFKTEAGQGDIVTLRFGLNINYTENTVSSGSKHWFLDGNEIPFLSEGVTIQKDGKTVPVNDKKFKQTFLYAQQRFYNFTLPYTDNVVCKTLQKDILDGEINKVYELKYYDGVLYTEENYFTAKVVLFTNGNANSNKPDTASFNVQFTDADGGENATKYYLGVLDNPFDGSSENERWFDSQADQIKWYNDKIGYLDTAKTEVKYCEIKAPNLNSLVLTNQVFTNNFDTDKQYDVFDLCNKNYAVIKVVREDKEDRYFYYKITNCNIGANNQVIYDLSLDSVQTFIFDEDLQVDDSFIEKTHLDRWLYSYTLISGDKPSLADALKYGYYGKNDDNTYTLITSDNYSSYDYLYEFAMEFNGKADSKLFEREDIKEVAKRLVSRQRLKFDETNIYNKPSVYDPIYDTDGKSSIYDINKTPIWVYVFIDGTDTGLSTTKKYTFYKAKTQTENSTFETSLPNMISGDTEYFHTPTAVLAYPLTPLYLGEDTSGTSSSSTDKYRLFITSDSFTEFLSLNSGVFSYIKSIKLSIKPPIDINTGSLTTPYFTGELTNKFSSGYEDYYRFVTKYVGATSYSPNTKIFATNRAVWNSTYGCGYQPGIICITNDNLTPFEMKLSDNSVLPKLKFTKKTDIQGERSKEFNPKLNSIDYKEISLNLAGSQQSYDYQKINNADPKFTYLEPLSCDITKCMIRYKSAGTDPIFNTAFSNSYNGLIYSNDVSLPIANDQLSSYLANNKNAYLSFQNQQAQNLISGAMNMASSVARLASGDLTAGGSLANGALSTAINQYYNKVQFDLSIDNMKNAPNTLVNANGSALFANSVSDYGVYMELYEGLDSELESANDIMFRDGYNFNRFEESGKSIKDYCHTRRYFNYIKAVLGNIHGISMSDTMRADLKQRFENGIRFWHEDNVDYSKENYELSLSEN